MERKYENINRLNEIKQLGDKVGKDSLFTVIKKVNNS